MDMEIGKIRVNKVDSEKILGFASVELKLPDGSLYLNGLTVRNGRNGIFASYPQQKDAKGNYHNIYMIPRPVKDRIDQAIAAQVAA